MSMNGKRPSYQVRPLSVIVLRLLMVLVAILALWGSAASAQTTKARVKYGVFPLQGAGLTGFKRDLASDARLTRTNKARCRIKAFAKKSPVCDADHDGIANGRERLLGTNRLNKDTDADGLTDRQEILKFHTDPLRDDTDGNGISDGDEDSNGNGIADEDEDDKPGEGPTYEDLNDDTASTGCPATNFDQSGNTTEFAIPAPNVGNVTRGATAFTQSCKACHMGVEPGTNFSYPALKTRLGQAPMYITAIGTSRLADLVAYLNRSQTGAADRCNNPGATPTPTGPLGPTPIPTATATPGGTPCANTYFDSNGNTIQFGIPAPLTGNLNRGSSYFSLHCTSCHGDRGASFSYAQIKAAVTGPLMNITTVADSDFADLAAYANRSFANIGCPGNPTPTPRPTAAPSRTPTPQPTPTSAGCSNQYFSATGDTNSFSIPVSVTGNIGRGSGLYGLSCNGCHTGESTHGLSMSFTQLKASVTGPKMNISTVSDQQYADLTAYLNRSLAPQNCGGTPIPTPTPLDDISSGRLVFQVTCQTCHTRPSELRRSSANKIRQAIVEVNRMRGISLSTEQLRVLVLYLATV